MTGSKRPGIAARMVGSAVATMVWSSAARNIVSIRLIRMVWTSPGVSGAGGTIGGASLIAMSSGDSWARVRRGFRQSLLVSRSTALRFELVHAGLCVSGGMRDQRPQEIIVSAAI